MQKLFGFNSIVVTLAYSAHLHATTPKQCDMLFLHSQTVSSGNRESMAAPIWDEREAYEELLYWDDLIQRGHRLLPQDFDRYMDTSLLLQTVRRNILYEARRALHMSLHTKKEGLLLLGAYCHQVVNKMKCKQPSTREFYIIHTVQSK